jgi:hypothetical protein
MPPLMTAEIASIACPRVLNSVGAGHSNLPRVHRSLPSMTDRFKTTLPLDSNS